MAEEARLVLRIGSLLVMGALGVTPIPAVAANQPAQASQLTGSARITGRLIAADDGKPVRRAEVYLSGRPDAEPGHMRLTRTVETDMDGRFKFVDLPAGEYAILFNRLTGFVAPRDYKQTRLTERQTVDLNIRVQRTGAIEGRIIDEDGDPVLRAEVLAIDRVDVAGYFSLGTRHQSATTNDRGEFRIFNLAAGDYYLVAVRSHSNATHQPTPPPIGYVTTYYPGSTLRRDARAVTVQAGRDTAGASFTLSRRKLATLSVAAADSRGTALGMEASASLRRLDGLDMFSLSTSQVFREGAGFVFRGVEPGDYSLVVWTRYGTGESSYLKVSVDQKDLSLKVQTNTGARVSGRVIVDGRPAEGGPGLPNVWVRADKPPRTYGVSYAEVPSVQLRATDRFELRGLRGPMQLSGDVTYGKLVSIRRGGEDLAWKVIDFAGTEEIDDVVVELTTRAVRLELTVPRSSAGDSAEPLVFIFPEDRQRWLPGLAIQVSVPVRDVDDFGGTVISVLPGRYHIVALKTAAVLDPADPALLAKLVPLATPINLTAGEITKLTIPLANAPR